jgi:CheY-like chemotaxis protein
MTRALVVEDDPDQLFIVAGVLRRLGMDVETATNAAAMLEKLETAHFDVIVTDISMPVMNGVQAMQRARAVGHRSPVIVTTAMRDRTYETEVAALGGSSILLYKPFTIATLCATVQAALTA